MFFTVVDCKEEEKNKGESEIARVDPKALIQIFALKNDFQLKKFLIFQR